MNKNSTESEVFAALKSIIVEALRIDPAKIELGSRIFDDLGAESIDILDIRFRIEYAIGFKLEEGEIIRSLGEGLDNNQIREKLTVGSLAAFIRNRLQQA